MDAQGVMEGVMDSQGVIHDALRAERRAGEQGR